MEMPYRRLGRSGLKLSAVSLGSWLTYGDPVGRVVTRDCMAAAHDAGINFFDTAESYAAGEAEAMLGEVLRDLKWPRSAFVLSSKAYWGGQRADQIGINRKRLFDACHTSLCRLGVDYLDLFFCHRPDPETPLEETARAMNDLIGQGKVLYWGTSVWPAELIEEAWSLCDRHGWHRPLMEQPQYNMFTREAVEVDLAALCRRRGMGLTTWSPLMSGLLTGKYNEGVPEGSRAAQPGNEWLARRLTDEPARERIDKVKQMTVLARELDATVSQLAIAWCLRLPHVASVITGASRPEQLRENLRAVELVPRLDDVVLRRIDDILAGPAALE